MRRAAPPPPRTRWLGPTLATAAVLGGIVVWHLAAPAPRERLVPLAEPSLATHVEPPPPTRPEPASTGAPPTVTPEPAPPDAAGPPLLPDRRRGHAVTRVPSDHGTLMVQTLPWSVVWVDGERVGNTPISRLALPAGIHRVRLVVPSEPDSEQTHTVEVRAGETTRLVVRLGAEETATGTEPTGTGTIIIQSLPWARVFLDGRDTGRNTPVRSMEVAPGTHRLGLRTGDGIMHEEAIVVEPGATLRIVRQL